MSIWSKLGGPNVLAVSVPAAVGEGGRVRIKVVDVLDPDAAAIAAVPGEDALRALCARIVGDLTPGYLALLPDGGDVDRAAVSIFEGKLMITGEPVFDRPFALLQISLDDEDVTALEALDDVGRRRDRMLWALESRDRAQLDAAYREAIEHVAMHPRLADPDRWRIARGLEREYLRGRDKSLGAVPWPELPGWTGFVAGLSTKHAIDRGPVDRFELLRDVAGAPRAADATEVHWNTRILDGDRPVTDRRLSAGHLYTIASKIDPVPDDDAVIGGALAPEKVADGTEVTFVVQCEAPVLRAPGTDTWSQRVEGTVRYDGATGATDAVIVELQPVVADKLVLILIVIAGNQICANVRVPLKVEAAATGPILPPIVITPPPPSPVQTTVAVRLSGPTAALLLELTAADQVRVTSGPRFGQPCALAKNPAELATIAIDARNRLVARTRRYAADPAHPPFGLVDGPQAMLDLARIGADLHRACFGKPGHTDDLNRTALATTIADVATPGARMQVAAAFQPFPWAVFYDGAWRGRPLTDDPASVDPSGFWGRRFRIDRALVCGHGGAPREPVLRGPLRVQACLNPHLDERQQVKVVAAQRALFATFAGLDVRAPIESEGALRTYLAAQAAPCDLLYFFCHATAAVGVDHLFTFTTSPADRQARLILDDTGDTTGGIDVAAMDDLRSEPLDDRPLVFLNACTSAGGDQAFQPQLLLQFLERWQAAGVIGTDWTVPTLFADAFARALLRHFLAGNVTLAEAFARAGDEAFAQGNPFPLIYALYAPPELTFLPGAAP